MFLNGKQIRILVYGWLVCSFTKRQNYDGEKMKFKATVVLPLSLIPIRITHLKPSVSRDEHNSAWS